MTDRDFDKISQLAASGNAKAQHNLGAMYLAGDGVEQDVQEAAKWLQRAAEAGLDRSQHNLGLLHLQGSGVPQDEAAALLWFRKAADQGNVRSQFALATLYLKGQGTPQDLVKAFMWATLAADQESPMQEHITSFRDQLSSHLTPIEAGKARSLAREWREAG